MARLTLHSVFFVCILLAYLLIAWLTAVTKEPYTDEAWFYSPAINLVENGHMGTSIKEIAGTPWTRMDRYTYWQPPVHFIIQAGWYTIFPDGLFSMRFLSIFFGLICLVSIFTIVRKVTDNYWMALLAMFLTGIDVTFIESASDGRMDMMSTAFAFAAFAFYLFTREKNLGRAMLVGHLLVVLSGLTHPNGILALFGMIFLNIYLDRKNIVTGHVLLALIPYFAGAAGWGIYILQNPTAFWDQFSVNFLGKVGSRSIFDAVRSEFVERYLYAYGWSAGSSILAKLKLFALLTYFGGVIGSIFIARKNQDRNLNALLILFYIFFLVMIFLIGNKWARYMVYILPLYTALTAVSAVYMIQFSRVTKFVAVFILIIICAMQVGSDVRRIRDDSYHNVYLPVIEKIRELDNYFESDDDPQIIMGGSELAFELGFNTGTLELGPNSGTCGYILIEDPALGYFSGKSPDMIVLEPHFRGWFALLEVEHPEAYEYTQELLETDFESVYENRKFEVLVRKDL